MKEHLEVIEIEAQSPAELRQKLEQNLNDYDTLISVCPIDGVSPIFWVVICRNLSKLRITKTQK